MLVKPNPAVKANSKTKLKECILKLLMLEMDAPIVLTVNVNNELNELHETVLAPSAFSPTLHKALLKTTKNA